LTNHCQPCEIIEDSPSGDNLSLSFPTRAVLSAYHTVSPDCVSDSHGSTRCSSPRLTPHFVSPMLSRRVGPYGEQLVQLCLQVRHKPARYRSPKSKVLKPEEDPRSYPSLSRRALRQKKKSICLPLLFNSGTRHRLHIFHPIVVDMCLPPRVAPRLNRAKFGVVSESPEHPLELY
jgi:hypothetical protein